MKFFAILLIYLAIPLAFAEENPIEGQWFRVTSSCGLKNLSELLPIDENERIKNLHSGMVMDIQGDKYFQTIFNPDSCKSGQPGCINRGRLAFNSQNTVEFASDKDETYADWGSKYVNWSYEIEEPFLIFKIDGVDIGVCRSGSISILFQREESLLLM